MILTVHVNTTTYQTETKTTKKPSYIYVRNSVYCRIECVSPVYHCPHHCVDDDVQHTIYITREVVVVLLLRSLNNQ